MNLKYKKSIIPVILIIGSMLIVSCRKQHFLEQNNYQYQDSLLFELEYNSLDFHTDSVDFDTNGFTDQL